jgi:hypothetical protein
MPKQIGIIPVKGTMNNMSFYNTADGKMVKTKSAINRSTFDSAKFAITRRNAQEFALAAKAGKLLRKSVQPIIGEAKESRYVSRITSLMLEIAKTDTVSPHGQRNVSKGLLEKLEGLNFNINAALKDHFPLEFTASIDRPTGKMMLNIPGFDPARLPLIPEGATHFKLVSSGSELIFEKDVFHSKYFDSGELPLTGAIAAQDIIHQLDANSTYPLVVTFGLQFFQLINGTYAPIMNTEANALAIVKLDLV